MQLGQGFEGIGMADINNTLATQTISYQYNVLLIIIREWEE
nr:MAG TPA: hypothetical protein [Caudoviricetes sp.]